MEDIRVSKFNLEDDDILIIKYPTDDEGFPLYDMEFMQINHKAMSEFLNNKILSTYDNIEFMKISRNKIVKRKRKFIK